MPFDPAALASKLFAALADPTLKAELARDVEDVKTLVADIEALVTRIKTLSA